MHNLFSQSKMYSHFWLSFVEMRLCLLMAALAVGVSADWNSAMSKIKLAAQKFGFLSSDEIETNNLPGDHHPHHKKHHPHPHHHKHHHGKHEHHHKRHHHHHHKKPWFCHKLECPHFVTVRKGNGYDVRCYHGNVWVKTNAEEKDVKGMLSYKMIFNGNIIKS